MTVASSTPSQPDVTLNSTPESTDAPAGPAEYDSEGIPWDARIHAGNKSKIQAGTWRRRRGISDDEYNKVVAELKGTAEPEPQPQESAPAAPQPQEPAPAAPQPLEPAPQTQQPSASHSASGLIWPEFMQRLQAGKQAGTYNDATMAAIMQREGIAAVPLFYNRPDLWDTVLNEMLL